jgi:phosphoglycerate dehydrogenase-like enzyme
MEDSRIMSSLNLLVIARPSAPVMEALSRVPVGVESVISDKADELKTYARQADVILIAAGDAGLLREVLGVANRTRWVHCLWTGVEEVLPAVIHHPATLTNGRGVFRRPLADWVTAAMLFFAFDLRRVIQQQEQGLWQPFVGESLSGRTLGIVGYGSIGSEAAERARPFGMKIAALRRRRELFQDAVVDETYDSSRLNDLMAASDYVLVSTALTEETRGMIGAKQIDALKSTAVILNVGRGAVIDELALIRALESGRIRGAALDVFTTEPLPAGHPFWRLRNVLLSPHTADRVERFLDPAFECFLENLDRFTNGRPLLSVVDKQAGY